MTLDQVLERMGPCAEISASSNALVPSNTVHALAAALVETFNAELDALANSLREELQRKPEPGSRFVVIYDEE